MNELIFFGHILLILAFLFGALRFGKECLIAFFALLVIIANLFVTKEIQLCSFTVTATDAFMVGGFLGMSFLQEFFGKKAAEKTIKITFFTMLFFGVMAQVHLLYTPSSFDQMHSPFKAILSTTPRIFFASFCTTLLAQKIHIELFAFFKEKLPFVMCTFAALFLSQLFDTLCFSVFGLYGLVSHLAHIMIVSFILKLVIMSCMTPFMMLAKRLFLKDAPL